MAIALLPVAWVQAGTQVVFSKGPYLQSPAAHAMTIVWESPLAGPARVLYGEGRRLDRSVAAGEPAVLDGLIPWVVGPLGGSHSNSTTVQVTHRSYVYGVTLENLTPDTLYAYRVEMLGEKSPRAVFRTFGAGPDRVRFIAYGDTRSQPGMHRQIARQFARFEPAFILHTGDLVGKGRNYALWSREFFDPLQGVIDRVPLLPALGNHEEDGTNYLKFFRLPPPGRWYSFDVGPVHILALDYHFEKATHEQFAFAQEDLRRSRAPWKVVFLHYPMFNVGGHATTWGHQTYLPLFHEADVDLVLGGHSHLYERFRPLAADRESGRPGIVHITTGGGGAPLYPVYDNAALAAKASLHHFLVLEATADQLEGKAVDIRGRAIDHFTLVSRAAQARAGSRGDSFPEMAAKAYFEVSSQLVLRLPQVPIRGRSVRAALMLEPLKAVPGPVDVELRVAPASSTNYVLPGGPLVFTVPAAGASNRMVWTEVSYRGSRTVSTNSSGVLVPPLILEGHFRYQGEAMAARSENSKVALMPAN